MTMLDRMRRHKNWLKWSLALVCLAFIVLYIPVYLQDQAVVTATPSEVLASVEGLEITAGQFRQTYQDQLVAYRGLYGGNISESLLRQLGIERQILQQMIDELAAQAEAERLGIQVSSEDTRERILTMPAFQENGQFIGWERYQLLLRRQRPPRTPAQFEASVRMGLRIEKLRAALTDWLTVGDAEVEAEYRRRNQKVKLEVVSFLTEKLRDQVSVSDSDVASYFEGHKAEFRIEEKRKIRYALADVDTIRSKITVPNGDVERYYNDNVELYSTPEQVRASHILFKTEGKDEAAVRKGAEDVLRQARAGTDFAELARQHSEDEASRAQGGDLDYFGRGRMVPEFEQAAFDRPVGEIGDLVGSPFGLHIIKVTDRKAATTRSVDEVRAQIAEQLAGERAQDRAMQLAEAARAEVDGPGDFDSAAKAGGLLVQESGLFTREDPIPGLGLAPAAAARAFEMKEGEVSEVLRVPRGHLFLAVTGRQDPSIPKLDEVRDRVREEAIKDRAAALARERATSAAQALQKAADLAAAARKAGLELKTTELIARGTPIPDIGVSRAIEAVAFSLPIGQVSQPIVTDNGTAVIRVVERTDVDRGEFEKAKEGLRLELLGDRRGHFYTAYMTKAKQRMTIEVDWDTLRRALG